jgi:EXS family
MSLQFRIFTAPFHFVGFSDFWLADQLNSLSTVLLDFEYLICYYAVEVSWHEPNSKFLACIVHHIMYVYLTQYAATGTDTLLGLISYALNVKREMLSAVEIATSHKFTKHSNEASADLFYLQ